MCHFRTQALDANFLRCRLGIREQPMLRRVVLSLGLCMNGLVAVTGWAYATEITVMSDTPVATALSHIGDLFRQVTGNEIKFVFGLSPVIHKKVTDGEPGDVLIIQPNFISDLVASGKIAAGQHPTIARVGIGLFMRADAQAPDVSTVPAFRQALLNADALVFSNVAAGNYFATVLERLGITNVVKDKVVRASPPDLVARVLQGKGSEIGVMVVTLIKADKRLRLIGTLPAELQSYLNYTAAPLVGSPSPRLAGEFIDFLSSPRARKEFVASGAE
jgi:molybdate transport system substrate-binding protein